MTAGLVVTIVAAGIMLGVGLFIIAVGLFAGGQK